MRFHMGKIVDKTDSWARLGQFCLNPAYRATLL